MSEKIITTQTEIDAHVFCCISKALRCIANKIDKENDGEVIRANVLSKWLRDLSDEYIAQSELTKLTNELNITTNGH